MYDAAVLAIAATDKAVKTVADAALAAGYTLLITSDHGNAEQMLSPEGTPHTAHTTNPVPCIITPSKNGDEWKLSGEEGALCDVAPTILTIMVSLDSTCRVERNVI